MSKYILSIDQGTTSTRSMIFDSDFKIICAIGRGGFGKVLKVEKDG